MFRVWKEDPVYRYAHLRRGRRVVTSPQKPKSGRGFRVGLKPQCHDRRLRVVRAPARRSAPSSTLTVEGSGVADPVGKAVIVKVPFPAASPGSMVKLTDSITTCLLAPFAEKKKLGNPWASPAHMSVATQRRLWLI